MKGAQPAGTYTRSRENSYTTVASIMAFQRACMAQWKTTGIWAMFCFETILITGVQIHELTATAARC